MKRTPATKSLAQNITQKKSLYSRALKVLDNEKTTAWLIFSTISFVFSAAVCALQIGASDRLIESDGIGYFAHLPSILVDGNMDYRNEMAQLGLHLRNHWTVGTAISWLPFYLVGHLISQIGAFSGQPWPVDGMGFPEQLLCCLGTVIYGAAAVTLSYRIARRWFGPYSSFFGTFVFFSAGNLPYYLLAEPYMSHGVSAFWSSLLLYVSVKKERLTRTEWIAVGALAGICALTRPQDGLLLAVPFLWHALRGWPWKELLFAIVVTGVISAFMFSAQVVIWKHGIDLERGVHKVEERAQRIRIPVQTKSETAWLSPPLLKPLFNPLNGLLVWHPVFLLAWLGLALHFRERPRLSIVFLSATLIQVYIISAWGGQGQSFGGRMFLGTFAYFNLGIVALCCKYGERYRKVVSALSFLLILEAIYCSVRYRMLVRGGDYSAQIGKVLWPGG